MANSKVQDFKLAIEDKQRAVAPEGVDEERTFTIEGEGPYTMYYPDSDQLAVMLAGAGSGDGPEVLQSFFEFLQDTFEEESYRKLRRRIRDRNDPLTIMGMMNVMHSLVAEWTGFPTQPASGSTQSRPSAGKRSTGRVPGKGSTLSS